MSMKSKNIYEITYECCVCKQKLVYRIYRFEDIFKCLELSKQHWKFKEVFGNSYYTCKECNINNFDDRLDINSLVFNMYNLDYLKENKDT